MPVNRAKASLVAEAVDAGGLPDEDRRGQHSAAGHGQQRGSQPADQVAQFTLQVVDRDVQLAATLQQCPCEAGDGALDTVQVREQVIDHAVSAQAAAGDVQVGVELVQVPADLGRDPSALDDQVTAVVREQLHLPRRPVQLRDRQV